MDGSLASIFDSYVFTSGRALFALRQVRSAAHEQGFTALVGDDRDAVLTRAAEVVEDIGRYLKLRRIAREKLLRAL